MSCARAFKEFRADHSSRFDQLDFADVRTIMSEGGAALMAVGRQRERMRTCGAEQAISSQLLDITIVGHGASCSM